MKLIRLHAFTFCASAFAAATTITWTAEARAIVVNVSGINYDVTSFTGTYNDNASRFTTAEMPWWGNNGIADLFAQAVGTQLGLPNFNLFSPFYSFSVAGNVQSRVVNSSNQLAGIAYGVTDTRTYAVATALPSGVPAPLPLLGAATGFAWSRRLRLRIARNRSEASS